MTAPTTTARGTITGSMLENGYQTLIAIADATTISLWEKTVQPIGLEGGEKIDISTMHNETYKTYAAQALIETTDSQTTVAYDPAVLSTIVGIVNVVKSITVHFPDTSTWDFYGFLKNFQPSALANGAHPEATVTVVTTNKDPISGDEEPPVYTAPA